MIAEIWKSGIGTNIDPVYQQHNIQWRWPIDIINFEEKSTGEFILLAFTILSTAKTS